MRVRHVGVSRAVVLVSALVMIVTMAGGPSASAAGRIAWQRLFSDPEGAGLSAASAPDGSAVFVAGEVDGDAGREAVVIAYDPSDGHTLWETRYDAGLDDSAGSIALSPDGGTVYVAGASYSAATADDFLTLALDARDGSQRWAATYNGADPTGNDEAADVAVTPDGATVVVTGSAAQGLTRGSTPTTVAYDAVSGARRWARWDTSAQSGGGLFVAAGNGSVFVSAQFFRVDASRFRTYAYATATGQELWRAPFGGGVSGTGLNGMVLAPDGSHLYVVGNPFSETTPTNRIVVISYDTATGAEVWKTFTAGRNGIGASPGGIAITPDGSTVVVVGSSLLSGSRGAALVWAIDAGTGHPRWRHVRQPPGDRNDAMLEVGVAPDGSAVYASGIGCPTASCDGDRGWLTLAYRLPDGAPLWSARFARPDTDNRVFGLAVTPTPLNVVVVGDSHSNLTDVNQFATIAYAG
jgi:DNA-binding beta-propeller fold protein YncE